MPLRLWRVTYSLGLALVVLLLALPRPLRTQGVVDVSAGIESYREFTLPNGLRVVFAVDHRVPQVALRIDYAVGDALDPAAQRGLAQLIGAILPVCASDVYAVEITTKLLARKAADLLGVRAFRKAAEEGFGAQLGGRHLAAPVE
jgi:hypothetical protein